MKILLRNKSTGTYYQGIDKWTERLEQAFNFQGPERAVKFALDAGLKLKLVEVILAFDNSQYNISLPIDERFGVPSYSSEGTRAGPLWPNPAVPRETATAVPS